jgi:hypothetical protein
MSVETPVEVQVRLLLQRQCAELGRWIGEQLRGLPFALFLAEFGEGGNVAFVATDDKYPEIVRSWMERGVVATVATAAEKSQLEEAARAFAGEIGERCPAGAAFALFFHNPRDCNLYLSLGNRQDMRRLFEEWLTMRGAGVGA